MDYKKEDISAICINYGISDYTINDDLSIDVNGSVRINNYKFDKIPIRFNNVLGNFYCSNTNLTTLYGFPKKVYGSLYCSENKLTSLEYFPTYVEDEIFISDNQLTSLKGISPNINSEIYCNNNKLKNLKYLDNIKGTLYAKNNEIDTLEYTPNCDMLILNNNKIKSLKSNGSKIKRDIILNDNPLEDISGLKLDFGGEIYCEGTNYFFLIDRKPMDYYEILFKWKIINGDKFNLKRFEYLCSIYEYDFNYLKPSLIYDLRNKFTFS